MNNEIFKDPETGKVYKLALTEEEIDILEPSIYLQSYRIKSSMKKATQVNRFVRGYKVKNAINQLHFNPKKMSTELEKLLKKGLERAVNRTTTKTNCISRPCGLVPMEAGVKGWTLRVEGKSVDHRASSYRSQGHLEQPTKQPTD